MSLLKATCLLLLCALAAAAEQRSSLRGFQGRSLRQDTGLLCSAESGCISKACTSAYANNASDFPYALSYTRSGDANSTTFVFSLCSEACEDGADFCHPLKGFQLRLSDQLVSEPKYIRRMASGSLVQKCSPRGPGAYWDRQELGKLGKSSATNKSVCELFLISVFHPPGGPQLELKDICQQGVQIVNKNDDVLFDQADAGASCLFILENTDSASGFGVLMSKDYNQSGSPELPSPSPAARPSPSPAARPSPSPSGGLKPQEASPSPVPARPSPSPVVAPSPSPVAPAPPSPSGGLKPQEASPSPVAASPSPALPSPSPVATSPSPALPSPSPVATSPSPVLPSPSPALPSPAPYAYSPRPYSPSPSPYAYASPSPPAYYSPSASELSQQGRRLFGSSNAQFQAWSARVLAGAPAAAPSVQRRQLTAYAPPSPPAYSPSPVPYYSASPSPAYSPSPSPYPGYSPSAGGRRRLLTEPLPLFGLDTARLGSLLAAAAPAPGRRLAAPMPYYSPPTYSPSPAPYSPSPYSPSPSPYSPPPYSPAAPPPGVGRRLLGIATPLLATPLFSAAAKAPAPAAAPAWGRRLAAYSPSPLPYYTSPQPPAYYSPQPPSYSPQPYASPPAYSPAPSTGAGRRLLQFAAAAPAAAPRMASRQLLAYYSPQPPAYSPSPAPYYSPIPYYGAAAGSPAPAPQWQGRRLFGAATVLGTTEEQLRQWSRQLMQVGAPAPVPAYRPSPSPYASPAPYSYSPRPYASPSPSPYAASPPPYRP